MSENTATAAAATAAPKAPKAAAPKAPKAPKAAAPKAAAPANRIQRDTELRRMLDKALKARGEWALGISKFAFRVVLTARQQDDGLYAADALALLEGRVSKEEGEKVKAFFAVAGGIRVTINKTTKAAQASMTECFDQRGFQNAYAAFDVINNEKLKAPKTTEATKVPTTALEELCKRASTLALNHVSEADADMAAALNDLLRTIAEKRINPRSIIAMLSAK